MDPNYPLVPVFNFFSAFLLLLLQPWRFYSWSVGIRVYVAWLALLCMCIGVNSVVWKDNTRDVSPAWCEFGALFSLASILLNELTRSPQ